MWSLPAIITVFSPGNYADIKGVDNEKGTLMGKPAVMAGFWGSHMGLIDLLLEKNEDGKWAIASHVSEARPIYKREKRKYIPLVESVASVLAPVQKTHEETLDYIRRPVGKPPRRFIPILRWWPMIRPFRSFPTRSSGTLRRC